MLANDWLAAQHAADQRQFRNLLAASLAVHVVAFGLLAIAPRPGPSAMPRVLTVDLVAGIPAASAPARLPPPAPKAEPKPAPAPPPKPAPPPPPKPKQVVLPKEAPAAVPKKPVERAVEKPVERTEPVQYEDALSQLRDELGEETPSSDAAPSEDVSDDELMATTAPAPGRSGGSNVDPEVARWVLATQRHVRDRWITPPEFLNRRLATVVEVELDILGDVLGTPKVVQSSGDPFFDDNAIRAVKKSSPLPAPPGPGSWTFMFKEG